MNTKDQALKNKLEEIKRLAQEAEELAKEIIEGDDYNTDRDFLGSSPYDLDEIWSIANRNSEAIDSKAEYDKILPWS